MNYLRTIVVIIFVYFDDVSLDWMGVLQEISLEQEIWLPVTYGARTLTLNWIFEENYLYSALVDALPAILFVKY